MPLFYNVNEPLRARPALLQGGSLRGVLNTVTMEMMINVQAIDYLKERAAEKNPIRFSVDVNICSKPLT